MSSSLSLRLRRKSIRSTSSFYHSLPLSLSLLFSPFLIYLLSPLTFSQLILINCFTYPFLSFFTFDSFRRFSPSRYFSSEFFSLLLLVSYFVSTLLIPISRPLLVSLVPYYFHSSLSSRLNESYPFPHFLLSLISTYRSTLAPPLRYSTRPRELELTISESSEHKRGGTNRTGMARRTQLILARINGPLS